MVGWQVGHMAWTNMLFVTALQALSQLCECRQQLDLATTEKSSLAADVARLSEECSEAFARLQTAEVLYLFFYTYLT